MIERNCVQQLKDYDPKRMTYPCIGQVKMDGIFGRHDGESGKFYTRSGNEIRGLSVLEEEMKLVKYPHDGELVIPKLDFFTMNGLIRSFNETPTCKYYIFDMPEETYNYGIRHDTYTRYHLLKGLPHVVRMQAHWLKDAFEADLFYSKVLKAGHEGVVYKSPKGLYVHGKHWENMKRVPVKSCECRILEAYEGKGKFEGMLGGFIVDFNGVRVKVGGGPGVDVPTRQFYWDQQEEAIGQMMKCQYKKLTNKGSMRSPQMLGIRWDI